MMYIFHNSVFRFRCYRWCAYFSGCDELLHHICKLFFCPHAKQQQARSLCVLKCLLLRTGENAFRNFLTEFFQPTTSDCQNLALSLNLLFSLTFIYDAIVASDIDREKNHIKMEVQRNEKKRPNERDDWEWFKLSIYSSI